MVLAWRENQEELLLLVWYVKCVYGCILGVSRLMHRGVPKILCLFIDKVSNWIKETKSLVMLVSSFIQVVFTLKVERRNTVVDSIHLLKGELNTNQDFTKFRFRPRLHVQFFARDGHAICFKFCRVTSARWKLIASVATLELPTRQLKKSREIQLNQFSRDFFQRLFLLSRCQFKSGYNCDFHRALATRPN